MGAGGNRDPRVYYLSADNHVHELAWSGNNWGDRDVTTAAQGIPATPASPLTAMGAGGNRDPRIYYLSEDDNHVHELAWLSNSWGDRDVTTAAQGIPATPGSPLTAMGAGGNRDPRVYYLDGANGVHEYWWSGSSWGARAIP
jgi:hypothetical protein